MEIFYVLIALAVISIVVVLASRKHAKLKEATIKRILRLWDDAVARRNPNTRVLEAEKVVDLLLRELGHTGSFGDKLKTIGKSLPNEQAVWSAHKLRNRIAHEAGVEVSEREAEIAIKSFGRVITKYTR
jgi:hypothetical protein